ncbi:MAG: hypothetical protein FWD69_10580 [Polyangiaceae bacterium]|nr:hypothetical protein [Polyangiaceae bacterium]
MVVEQIAQAEHHAHNHIPFFVLEDASTKDSGSGWIARAERMAVIHEARREVTPSLGEVAPPHHSKDSLAVMGWQLKQCLEAQQNVSDANGIVVVLAPTAIAHPRIFARDVSRLVQTPSLSAVRYIVVELGGQLRKRLVSRLGDACMCVNWAGDEDYRREQNDRLAAMAAAPIGASSNVSAGFVGPKDAEAPTRKQRESEANPSPAIPVEGEALLQTHIAGAAIAVQKKNFRKAIALQRDAVEQCGNLVQLACILECTLASYLLQAGNQKHARTTFEASAKRAEEAGFLDVAAQALLGLAALQALDKDKERALVTYARAGDLAAAAGAEIIAIEAYRAGGQIALPISEKSALILWQRALRLASANPDVATSSSVSTVARAFAKVAQKHGAHESARSLLELADEYERAAAAADTSAAEDTDADTEEGNHVCR